MLRPVLRNAGMHPQRLVSAIRGWRRYVRERTAFQKMAIQTGVSWGRELPMLTEWDDTAGSVGTYFFQDQLVAGWIFESKPRRHVDVGSRLDGFVGSVSVFREIEVIDIRPAPAEIMNVKFHQMDLMETLSADWEESTDSLSCLHTIEHFGLGRYGDPIEVNGHLKGLAQLKRMVAPGGMIYLSTPIGPERVEFNAHRVFEPETLVGWFSDGWAIERCAVIDEQDAVVESTQLDCLREFRGNLGVGIIAARRM